MAIPDKPFSNIFSNIGVFLLRKSKGVVVYDCSEAFDARNMLLSLTCTMSVMIFCPQDSCRMPIQQCIFEQRRGACRAPAGFMAGVAGQPFSRTYV